MPEKTYYIEHLQTKKYYTGFENGIPAYSEEKESAKILTEAQLGQELINIRLKGDLVEFRVND